jgi:hypothetical protein
MTDYSFQEMNDSLFEKNDSLFEKLFDAKCRIGKKGVEKPMSAKDPEDAKSQFIAFCKSQQKAGHLPKGEIEDVKIGEGGKFKETVDLDALECLPLEENSTENAKKSLQAILGMFKGKHDHDIYKMGKGIMDYYKDKGSFAPGHAKWIWKTSVALFKN